jgi:hypothetical protein
LIPGTKPRTPTTMKMMPRTMEKVRAFMNGSRCVGAARTDAAYAYFALQAWFSGTGIFRMLRQANSSSTSAVLATAWW